MSVTVICNVSQRQVVVNRLELGGGWGSAPDWRQAGSRALGQQLLGCQRGSGRLSGNSASYSLSAIRAALARPCVAADTRASGRTLRACCPLGAPLGGCSASRRAAPCPRCSRGTLPQGTPACGPRTAQPARHPAQCLLAARCAPRPRHLRRRPIGLRAGLPLAQPAQYCKGKPRRWRGGKAALAILCSRCPIAATGAQALSGSAPAAARGLSLAPPWWGQANRPCNGPGPVGPALII